jgi:16S rRNA C967 or C1407 C5-methylase (RsmB/RsmF family)
MSKEFLQQNIVYMNYSPTPTEFAFRINNLRSKNGKSPTLNHVVNSLKEQGILSRKDKSIPFIYYAKTKYKRKILTNEWHKEGFIVLHDKASFLITQLLSPSPNDIIGDICAAPGIKTSIIAQLSKNQSKIIACDFNGKRLEQAKNFFQKLGVSNYFLLNCDSTVISEYFQKAFDKILIDAPCTGSGTFLNHPELKWRQNYEFLNQNIILQEKMLQSGLKMLKSGGILVYSTCSLYPEEGEYQIKKILDLVEPLNLPDYFSPSYTINGNKLKGAGRLFPSIHNTQSFFVSKLKKK